ARLGAAPGTACRSRKLYDSAGGKTSQPYRTDASIASATNISTRRRPRSSQDCMRWPPPFIQNSFQGLRDYGELTLQFEPELTVVRVFAGTHSTPILFHKPNHYDVLTS